MEVNLNNESVPPEALRGLTEEQTERLTGVLDRYLASLEAHEPLDLERLLSENEDLRAPLQVYIERLGELHNFAAGFSPHLADLDVDEMRLDDEPFPPDSGIHSNLTVRDAASTDARASIRPGDRTVIETGSTPPADGIPADDSQGEFDPESSSPTARRLGDFELLRVIGRGGMGTVYEAEQLSLRRRVALKLLPLISVLDARQVARFKNEAQAAAALQHPHIVPVFAVGNYRGVHYYAMQLIDGFPLDAIIAGLRKKRRDNAAARTSNSDSSDTTNWTTEQDREEARNLAAAGWTVPTDMRRVVRLGIEAATALAAAHEEGIIHRDIKPSNLLVDPQDKLWVTDFGLARRINDHTLTASGDVLGTLRYMSPEQAGGQAALVDGRADIYSLGVTLYELLALEPAFVEESSAALLRAIEQQTPISLHHHRPDLPRDLVTVIETAIAKNRDERYLTAQHFADDLNRVLEGRPTLAKPPTRFMRAMKWAIRHRRLVKAASAMFLLTALCLGIGTWIVVSRSLVAYHSAVKAEEAGRGFRELLERSHTSVSENLKFYPGTEHIRRELLVDMLNSYRKYLSGFQKDPGAQAEVALVHQRIGVLYRELGDLLSSEKHLRTSYGLYKSLSAARPNALEPRRQLAVSAHEIARSLASQGNTEAAVSSHQQAVAMQRVLLATHRENADLVGDLARSQNEFAILLAKTKRRTEAKQLLDDARSHLVDFTQRFPEDLQLKSLLAATYINLCSVVGRENPAEAAQLYRLSLEVQQQVLDASAHRRPPNPTMAVTYSNLGKVLASLGELTEALDAYEKAIAIQRQLLDIAPDNARYSRDLSISLNNRGLTQARLKQLSAAQDSFHEAIALHTRLLEQLPGDAVIAHELGGAYNNLAMVLESLPDAPAVEENFEQAIHYQRQAQEAAPDVASYQDFLDNHLHNYSRWLRKTHRDERALATALERREIWAGNPNKLLAVATDLAATALEIASAGRQPEVADRYAESALKTLRLAQDAGLGVQSLLTQEPFSSLAKFHSPTEVARP